MSEKPLGWTKRKKSEDEIKSRKKSCKRAFVHRKHEVFR